MSSQFLNVSEVPLALAVFLASDNYDYNNEPNTISATTLMKPIRQVVLPPRMPLVDAKVNLGDMMNNRLGAAIHDAIERAWTDNHEAALSRLGYPTDLIKRIAVNPDPKNLPEDCIPIYLEQRLTRKLGKWNITGKFDFIGEGRVQDFKTTNVWTYKNQVNTLKYTQQGSIYRWLNPNMITDEHMDIIYIFKDWKASGVRSDPGYPPKAFHKQSFTLLDLPTTERFIKNKVDAIEKYWDAPEEDIPYCTDEDLWRSEPIYKYYKNPLKTSRSTKNYDNMPDAMIHFINDGSVGIVKTVPGQVTACKYCPAFSICSQKDQLIASGDLLME